MLRITVLLRLDSYSFKVEKRRGWDSFSPVASAPPPKPAALTSSSSSSAFGSASNPGGQTLKDRFN